MENTLNRQNDAVLRLRIASIDTLRGLIMLVMAIDHTRDFFHLPAVFSNPLDLNTTTAPIFFTRWITHYCAPIFVFLSGLSAYLSGQRRTKSDLSMFLIKRGLWLVAIELVVVSFAISFSPTYQFFIFQVIWAIGWSMVILGLLIRTNYTVILVVGLILFFGHNLLEYVQLPKTGFADVMWKVLFTSPGAFVPLGGTRGLLVAYPILPWTGIMLIGYAFGRLYARDFDAARRRRLLLTIGFCSLLLFVILRFINQYGDPSPWSHQKTAFFSFLSFINVTKYPVSLQYGCMTLGMALLFLAMMENVRNGFTRFASVYGSVPFFYYILHFYLIHILCVILFFATNHSASQIVTPGVPFNFRPPQNFGFPLIGVYVVWLIVILSLYYPCKWFSNYKKTHTQWWLSYL